RKIVVWPLALLQAGVFARIWLQAPYPRESRGDQRLITVVLHPHRPHVEDLDGRDRATENLGEVDLRGHVRKSPVASGKGSASTCCRPPHLGVKPRSYACPAFLQAVCNGESPLAITSNRSAGAT